MSVLTKYSSCNGTSVTLALAGTDAINNLPLTKELAEKLLQNPQATISDLRNEILTNMNDI